MQHILNDSQINTIDKDKFYTQNLGTYLNMRDKRHDIQHVSTEQNKPDPIDTLSTCPKTLQTKAKSL